MLCHCVFIMLRPCTIEIRVNLPSAYADFWGPKKKAAYRQIRLMQSIGFYAHRGGKGHVELYK